MSKKIIFVTHNQGKVLSAQEHFNDKDIKLEIYDYELDEPRSDDVEMIAKAKVIQAYNLVKRPCFALDTGFYIEELNGFPKAFVNFSLETIGVNGILKLMDGVENRNCYFKECLAYMKNDNPDEIKYFYATIPGTLSTNIMGKDAKQKWSDLWYIFIPEGYDITLAQMTEEQRKSRNELNECYGKLSATRQFAKWIE